MNGLVFATLKRVTISARDNSMATFRDDVLETGSEQTTAYLILTTHTPH